MWAYVIRIVIGVQLNHVFGICNPCPKIEKQYNNFLWIRNFSQFKRFSTIALGMYFSSIPNKEPLGFHNIRLTWTDGSLTRAAWSSLKFKNQKFWLSKNETYSRLKINEMSLTFNAIELAPISHTWKFFANNLSIELTSHKLMSPRLVPTKNHIENEPELTER